MTAAGGAASERQPQLQQDRATPEYCALCGARLQVLAEACEEENRPERGKSGVRLDVLTLDRSACYSCNGMLLLTV